MIEDTFLAVNKKYLDIGLKSVDILIISQIEEFERNNCQCYLTNRQFSDKFGESESTIKRTIKKLDKLNIIKRKTSFVDGNGKANKQRVLSLNEYDKWMGHIDLTKMEGSEIDFGRVKSNEWKGHNGPIKEKKKENIKDNIEKTKKIINLISFDDDVQEDIDLGFSYPEDCITDKFYSFASEEIDRLGDNVNFIISYDKISSYKNGKCMGFCC